MRSRIVLAVVLGWALVAFAGVYEGHRTCDYCHMFLDHEDFGGRLKTVQGKTLIFDASECMAAFSLSKIDPKEIRALRSVDHAHPGKLLDAKRAWYLRSDARPSPMAVNLSAYASRAEAERARTALGGDVLTWDQVMELIKQRWFKGKVD
jgi:copper chaperone NosL